MEPGNIVEYIDNQKIICSVILEIKKQRLRLLTENNREVNLSATRLSHKSRESLSLSSSRNKLVESLKETSSRRKNLISKINIKELWDTLYTESEWIDLDTMTSFCFSDPLTADHESAVVRAFFNNRIYFKFNVDRFMPNSETQVEKILAQIRKEENDKKIINTGGEWLKKMLNHPSPPPDQEEARQYIDIITSYYLFEKESPHANVGKQLLARAGIDIGPKLFNLLVKIGTWDKDENIDLLKNNTPVSFSKKLLAETDQLRHHPQVHAHDYRKDLTDLPIMTIDGAATLDFDDAISIEKKNDDYYLGIHIADVSEFVTRDGIIDREAMERASSIYLPDKKIPMLPKTLSEDMCSLKTGENRLAISTMLKLNRFADILEYDIVPSIINVKHQRTYSEVNNMVDTDEDIRNLYALAGHFRKKRLDAGAIQITLPEILVSLDEDQNIVINRMDRESPGRMLVMEMMIMANWITAKHLTKKGLPAVYRSQPAPKSRLLKDDEGTIFQNCMQRKHLSRVVIDIHPEHHSGLGVSEYVTATSPIRKYLDLVTQRQIRATLDLETPYSGKQVRHILQVTEESIRNVARAQFTRQRYWLLKYLEQKTGEKEEALVLDKRRDCYWILIPAYMIECKLAQSSGTSLKPGDLIQVTIQHANARNDSLAVFMG